MNYLQAFLMVILLSACAASQHNYEQDSIALKDKEIIAQAGAENFTQIFPEKGANLHLNPVGSFGKALTEALRQKGFAIDTNPEHGNQSRTIYYQLDAMDKDQIRLALMLREWRLDSLFRRSQESLLQYSKTQRLSDE